MGNWLNRITERKQSADEAKERLKLVLIHDRTDFGTVKMDKLKDELILTISNYLEIDPLQVKITMLHEGREQRLIADIPLKGK